MMSNPTRGSTHPSMLCHNLKLVIRGVKFPRNAYVLNFSKHGLSLGMDWISRYKVVLDYDRRMVQLRKGE